MSAVQALETARATAIALDGAEDASMIKEKGGRRQQALPALNGHGLAPGGQM